MIHFPAFWDSPTRRLRVTCGASTTLLFDLLGNHCCRNKPTDALVLQTLLYYYRGRPLLAPPPSIAISFATRNWFSTFWLISHWVTALGPFCVESSVL